MNGICFLLLNSLLEEFDSYSVATTLATLERMVSMSLSS